MLHKMPGKHSMDNTTDETQLTIDLSEKYFDNIKVFMNFFSESENITIFDVGANIGQSVSKYRKAFPKAEIYSFEPYKEAYDILHANNKNDKNVHMFNMALSNNIGFQEFFVNNDSNSNSSFNSLNLNSRSLKKNVHPKLRHGLSSVTVATSTVDDIVKNNGCKRINILKIDTQGHEPQVLDGAVETLASGIVDFVSTEIIFDDIYSQSLSFSDIENRISTHGFRLYDICHIYKDLKHMRTHWVDVVYVNTNTHPI
jgi:FkbM family methyltransferase